MLCFSSLELIGRTPLVELRRLEIPNNNRIFAKLEYQNPAGGIKDRVALYMLQKLRAEGQIGESSVLIEATAGNFGLGAAFCALHFGIKTKLVIPEKFSIEKQVLARALGAEVINTPTKDGMQGAIKLAAELLSATPQGFSLNQFENLDNPAAHFHTTGREIWEDLAGLEAEAAANLGTAPGAKTDAAPALDSQDSPHFLAPGAKVTANLAAKTTAKKSQNRPKNAPRLDYFVAGAGSGGSFSGIVGFLKAQDSRICGVLCDPVGSIIGGGAAGCANIEGIGNCFVPRTMDTALVDSVVKVRDEEAFAGVRALAKTEGLLAGISSGACVAACLAVAKRVENARIVTVFADSLSRYFSRGLV